MSAIKPPERPDSDVDPMSLADRLAELRRRQQADPLTPEQMAEAFNRHFAAHDEHPWEQVGRCVYCVPCGERLYQGTIPAGHPVGHRQSKPPRDLLGEFRQRWGDQA